MKRERHFLQTEAWGEFQAALGRSVLSETGNGWHWQAVVERSRFGARLYCPYGPTADSEAALGQALGSLRQAARTYGAMLARCEPTAPVSAGWLLRYGALPAHRPVQPQHTWRLSLAPSAEAIVAGMKATNRNLHRTAAHKGITFRKSSEPADIAVLLGFIHEVALHKRIRPHSDAYFRLQAETLLPRGAAHIFIAEHDGQPIAAALAYDSADTRSYAHAGSSHAQRSLHAGTPLVSHMILDAKTSGLSTFDFYGIAPPEEPGHPWAGFTTFKRSFGGEYVRLPGTWDIPLQPWRYRLYRSALHALAAARGNY